MGAAVDPDYAQWLRNGVLYGPATVDDVAARWGTSAGSTDLVSPIAFAADAQAEAARELAFLAGPIATDTIVVPGLRRDLLGRPHLDGAEVVFVVGVDEGDDSAAELTTLTVLRRMA